MLNAIYQSLFSITCWDIRQVHAVLSKTQQGEKKRVVQLNFFNDSHNKLHYENYSWIENFTWFEKHYSNLSLSKRVEKWYEYFCYLTGEVVGEEEAMKKYLNYR